MKTIPITHIKVHVIAWIVFIAYEIFASYFWSNDRLSNFADDAVHYALYMVLFYFNAHVALPSTIGENRSNYKVYLLLLLGQLAVLIAFRYLILISFKYLNIVIYPPPSKNQVVFVVTGLMRGIYFLGFSVAYWFALTTISNQRKVTELESQQLRSDIERGHLESTILSTENSYLKSQINPHFLFNTLNFLYNSISKFSEDTAETILTLADLMRYSLAETDEAGKVPLELELEHIGNFIKLNQTRFSQRLSVRFEVTGDCGGFKIIPLALMTIVENIFKYGDLFDPNRPVNISAMIDEQKLIFSTQNLIKKNKEMTGMGIGVENLKARLSRYHKYELEINSDDVQYSTQLSIWN